MKPLTIPGIASNYSAQDLKNPPRQVAALLAYVCLAGFCLLPLRVSAAFPSRIAGLTADQKSLFAALVAACPSASGELAIRCGQLQALSPAQQQLALVSLTPYQFVPQTGMPIKLWPRQLAPQSRQDLDSGHSSNRMEIDGQEMPLPVGSQEGEPLRDGPLGLIIQNKFLTGSKNVPLGGFNANAYELTLGADYRFTEQLAVGAAFAYNYSDTTMDRNTGNMRSNTYRAL